MPDFRVHGRKCVALFKIGIVMTIMGLVLYYQRGQVCASYPKMTIVWDIVPELLTLGAYVRGLVVLCVCVCVSVCLSVPALAASAHVYTCNQR